MPGAVVTAASEVPPDGPFGETRTGIDWEPVPPASLLACKVQDLHKADSPVPSSDFPGGETALFRKLRWHR